MGVFISPELTRLGVFCLCLEFSIKERWRAFFLRKLRISKSTWALEN
jgi:hypothetical protein